MTGPRLLLAPLVGILVVGLVACSPVPAEPTRTEAPTPSPSASATEAVLEIPPSQLPGDCDDFVAADVVSAVVGPGIGPAEGRPPATTIAEERQGGVLECVWSDDVMNGDRSYLNFSVRRHADQWQNDALGGPFVPAGLPEANVGADRSGISCTTDALGGPQCQISALVDDYAISVYARTKAAADLSAVLTSMVRGLVSTLRSSPVPAGWVRPSGAWPLPLDCPAIEASARIGDALGVPELKVYDATGVGEDYAFTPELASVGGRWDCVWADRDSEADRPLVIYATVVAGGGWAMSERSRESEGRRISVPGADEAVLWGSADRGFSVTLRRGVNLMAIGPGLYTAGLTEDQATVSARQVLAALQRIEASDG